MEITFKYSGDFCELAYDDLDIVNGGSVPIGGPSIFQYYLMTNKISWDKLSWADFKKYEQLGYF
ncbi:hypothetical protein [Clostridium grantii]|uniref:Uncharacterized protein n=1 Tax=Clostridium grantii DSM 8605 TaxID=1121316 RepID=A0A1M5Y7H5_9CLOT|nr:hypothetical protein [Clostridium grantii]SHI07926.1 hypothetical protein SAMN02745207_04257 [Clostridium grantii DSM 8605]